MKHNLLKSVILSVILLMGVSNAWSWNTLYLASSHNGWNSNKYGLGNSSTGTGVFYSYTPVDMDFKIVHAGTTWLGRDYGDKLKPGDGGFNFDKNKSSDCRYNGYAGIVGFNCNQKDHADDWPWIWLTRPTIKIKHWWGGSDNNWTAYNMEDNQNGTYSYIGYYSGYNQTNIGIEGSNATLKYIENAKLEGLNENTGNKKCLFTYNSNGYIGHGTASQNTGSLTITRLYTIKYDGNGSTTGVPSDHDKKHGTNTTLSSSIPTRTGYTFAGWNTKADGSGTNYAKGATYTANADVTLYAKWTAHTYKVQFNANGGTGSMSYQTFTYDVAQNLTKNTFNRSGYTFAGWNTNSSGTGTSYADQASVKNLTSTNNAIFVIYAKWTENKYPVNITANPAEAAKTLTSGPKQVGINPVNIATTTKIGYQFVNWTATAGITIANANNTSTTITATQAGTVTANFKANDATTVYLKTTANWKDANARFAIYYWGDNDQNGWVNMTEVDCNRDYFKGEIPYGSTGFNFVRMNPNALANNWDNDWNQTGNISVPTDSKNCFTITDDHWGEQNPTAEGTWGAFNPTLTLTLKSSTNGTYKVIYEGKTYESSLTEDVIIPNLPLNAEIYISESATPNAGYWLKERFIKLGTNEKVEATTKTTYTLCGNTTISANFVTIQPHTVYLNITNQNWASDNAKLAIYVYDETDGEGQGTWIALTQVGSSKYYTATIPKNESNFNFVRLKNNSTLDWSNKWNQTGNLAIPVTRYNTFTLTSFGSDGIDAEGKWGVGTAYSGDYRLAYVEQVVAKGEGADNWKTVIINDNTDSHTPDDIIRKRANGRDTISLFINVNGDNPEVILQQYDGSKWVDREAHMVNGPLEAAPGMAMLPGRKNASPDSDIDDFVYDDGIDAITESGVWNFVIVQDADGKASLLLKEDDKDVTHKYTGNYYIRTDNAAGGWNKYTHPDNIMSRSTYSESGYSHYYCKWVEIAQKPNVKFIVATDYSINVSKEFAKDDYTKDDGVLVENANVRWSWDENTGVVARAYIQGAYNPSTHARLENIVLDYTTDGTDNPENVTLDDSGDWIYTTDITVQSGATLETLTATYPSEIINDISPITQTFAEKKEMLTGMSDQDYTVRVLYDFKENETMIWLLPEKGAKTGIDVLIERVNHGVATQVAAPVTAMDKGEGEESFTVYAAISFTKAFVNGSESKDKRQFYWVSFPFNVDMKDVFGFGKYGTHWILEYYDGARRARDGWWKDSPSFWEYIIDTTNFVIEANKGYVLCLDLETMGTTSEVFQNTEKVTLYFPSKEKLTTIDQKYTMTQVVVPSYIRTDTRANRHIYDSNWNLIGVPSYANKDFTSYPTNLQYFYEYTPQDDPAKSDYTAKSANATPTFNSMYAYFVQWGGTINWETLQGENTTPQKMQAKKNADYEAKEHNLRLELQHNGAYTDQTFVALKEEGATVAFDLNLDLTKISGTCSGIYTLAGEENIQLAGNVLPLEDNTVIPVGVQVAKAGEYTFAMPDGTDGIVVELIDYETNTRTNMLLDNYTVNLGKGTFESRFALHVKPDKTTTSVDNIGNEATGDKVKKYLIDGVLYMQKDGVLYDAQGRCVQ